MNHCCHLENPKEKALRMAITSRRITATSRGDECDEKLPSTDESLRVTFGGPLKGRQSLLLFFAEQRLRTRCFLGVNTHDESCALSRRRKSYSCWAMLRSCWAHACPELLDHDFLRFHEFKAGFLLLVGSRKKLLSRISRFC